MGKEKLIKCLQGIGTLFSVICSYQYASTFLECYESNMDAFYWLNHSSNRIWGMLLDFIVFAVICYSTVYIIVVAIKRNESNKFINQSINLFFWCAFFHICALNYNNWWGASTYESDISFILYRVFGTYGHITGSALICAIMAVACFCGSKYVDKRM